MPLAAMEIVPAIIPKSAQDLAEKLSLLSGRAARVQVDVLDGSLYGARSWPYRAAKPDASFEEIVRKGNGLLSGKGFAVEAHFMVRRPAAILDEWIAAGAAAVIVELEGAEDAASCLARAAGRAETGLSIALDAPLPEAALAEKALILQCMGIRRIGFQGEAFDPAATRRVAELRRAFPRHIISVDGGVSAENARALAEAGADRLVVGSAIFGAPDPRAALEELLHVIAHKP